MDENEMYGLGVEAAELHDRARDIAQAVTKAPHIYGLNDQGRKNLHALAWDCAARLKALDIALTAVYVTMANAPDEARQPRAPREE